MNKKALTVLLASGVLALAGCGQTSDEGGCKGRTSGPDVLTEPAADGAIEYVDASYEARTEILGKLEGYAVDTGLTGLPLYENGGYVMYNPRVVKGTSTYVPNYGFSILRDGQLNGTLSGETDTKYQKYLHNWEASDPATINYLNDQGSQVGDLFGNIESGYFGTRLNSDKTGYEWYGVLAKNNIPYPVEGGKVVTKTPSATEMHMTWRIYLRTGKDGGIKYRTASTKADRASFNNRDVEAADYVNAFKFLCNGQNNFYRGAELAKQTGKSGLKGLSDYYSLTSNKALVDTYGLDFLWDYAGAGDGIALGQDADGDYIDFTFLVPNNRFYAMYNLGSSMYAPVPKAFTDAVGPEAYGAYNTNKTYSPVDNILSVGAYYLESWETDKLITFARNADWYEIKENPNLYRIEGIHTDVLTAYDTDNRAAFKEFLAGKLDSVGIPQDDFAEYKNDSRATQVPGDATFKLNINSCDSCTWEQLFGENGTVAQTAKSDYWNVKPWMSNDHFLKGLFYSIDRNTFASKRGSIASINYFSDNYLSNPEEGISYNTTTAHKNAIKNFWGDTASTGGYNLALSEAQFKLAIEDLQKSGAIKSDTSEISIDIWWMYTSQIKSMGEELASYIETAFNNAAAEAGIDTVLKVNNNAVTVWSDVYYKHLMTGQFDLGFGAISGNTLDPLNFMEVLKSDNSSGFTLNWGMDTSRYDRSANGLVYDGKLWSFDDLWKAADQGIILDKGKEVESLTFKVDKAEISADGKTLDLAVTITRPDYESLDIEVLDLYLQSSSEETDYTEIYNNPEEPIYSALDDTEVTDVKFTNLSEYGTLDKGSCQISCKITGKLVENIAKDGKIARFGVDYNKYISDVYLGLVSATADNAPVTKLA